jgi:hypothetical protein
MSLRAYLPVFFLSCLALSMVDCSLTSASKPSKKAEKPVAMSTSNAEWKERKWELYAEDRGGVQYFFEKDSVEYLAKDVVHAWRKRTFPGKSSSSQKEITSFDEIDCRMDRFRSLELQGLNWDDTTTAIYRRPAPWSKIYSETPDELIEGKLCRQPGVGQNLPK